MCSALRASHQTVLSTGNSAFHNSALCVQFCVPLTRQCRALGILPSTIQLCVFSFACFSQDSAEHWEFCLPGTIQLCVFSFVCLSQDSAEHWEFCLPQFSFVCSALCASHRTVLSTGNSAFHNSALCIQLCVPLTRQCSALGILPSTIQLCVPLTRQCSALGILPSTIQLCVFSFACFSQDSAEHWEFCLPQFSFVCSALRASHKTVGNLPSVFIRFHFSRSLFLVLFSHSCDVCCV